MQNRRKYIELILSLGLFIFATSSLPLECARESEYFLENLNERQVIAHVRIIEKVKYQNAYNRFVLDGLTKLEVIHSFRGNLPKDTLLHYDFFDGGHSTTFQFDEKGDEFLIKGNILKPLNTLADLSILGNDKLTPSDTIVTRLSKKYLTVLTHPCDHAIIPIEDNVAIGMFTKNIRNVLLKKYMKLRERNPQKAQKFYATNIQNRDMDQKLSISKAYNLIRKRLNSYR